MTWSSGQVALYCLIAFLLGAILSWLLLRVFRSKAVVVDDSVGADFVVAAPLPDFDDAADEASDSATEQSLPASASIYEDEPYGTGSANPLPDGSAPSNAFTVKGNADSMVYHTIESPHFGRTKAEVWFRTERDARKAGFNAWNERPN